MIELSQEQMDAMNREKQMLLDEIQRLHRIIEEHNKVHRLANKPITY